MNQTEIELAILTTQCLDRRISDKEKFCEEAVAREDARKALRTSVEWRFTIEEARVRLKHLYPTHGR